MVVANSLIVFLEEKIIESVTGKADVVCFFNSIQGKVYVVLI